jgi:hypothetical protein
MLYLSANSIRNMQMWERINSAVSKYWHEWRGKDYQMEEPAADKCRLVEGLHGLAINSLIEIPGIAIFLTERRNMVLRCFQDGFLAHVHKYLGFLVTDPVDMLR